MREVCVRGHHRPNVGQRLSRKEKALTYGKRQNGGGKRSCFLAGKERGGEIYDRKKNAVMKETKADAH